MDGMNERLRLSILALSAAGLIGIAVHEGYRENAYDDGVGVQTVGFGSTTHADGRPVRRGDKMSVERALVRLGQDVGRMQREMKACLGPVPLYPHEWDAYVSLAYNIGTGAFCRSTLVRRLKEAPPKYDAACAEILKWNRAGGQVLPGLVKRRQDEFKLCTEGRP
jgi:lysozyme